LYNLRRSQLEALHVRAGINGVLQLVPVEVGQSVAPGTNLARVADPKKLKAQIKIAETQANELSPGMKSPSTRVTALSLAAFHVSIPPFRTAPSQSIFRSMKPFPMARVRT